jgi:hypothetical protein
MKYEHDFIYQILPNLTKAVKDLTNEIKRYNDNVDSKLGKRTEDSDPISDVLSDNNND